MVHMVQVPHKRCGSHVVQIINAPLSLVWSIVRRFDQPQVFKKLIQTCTLIWGSGEVGSVRHVFFSTAAPAKTSVERLLKLDDEQHVLVYKVIDGDHKLVNFHVTIKLKELVEDGCKKTLVVESYTVDVPTDSNEEDTCYFANIIIELNLKNLAIVAERMASRITAS